MCFGPDADDQSCLRSHPEMPVLVLKPMHAHISHLVDDIGPGRQAQIRPETGIHKGKGIDVTVNVTGQGEILEFIGIPG